MSKRNTAPYPLVLAVLFGLAINLIPASSVLGDNITACQGSGSLSSSLKLGGRTVTPTLILQAATGNACPAGETSLGLVSLSRTLIVSSVVSPTQNGTALLTAMTLISNSNPSAANPWLLKLEPGNYDLGSQSLTLLPYVDLEGSGEGTTVISSTIGVHLPPFTKATLLAASNSEVRSLKVTNSGSATFQVALSLLPGTTNARFSHFTATASGGLGDYAVFSDNAIATFSASTIIAAGSSNNTGFAVNGGSNTIINSTITAAGDATGNVGFSNSGGTNTISNSTITASGNSANSNYGAYNGVGTTTVTNSTITASGTGSIGFGKASGTALAFNSLLSGDGLASSGLSGNDCTYSINATTHAPLNANCQ
jgi:hypothetical protein